MVLRMAFQAEDVRVPANELAKASFGKVKHVTIAHESADTSLNCVFRGRRPKVYCCFAEICLRKAEEEENSLETTKADAFDVLVAESG